MAKPMIHQCAAGAQDGSTSRRTSPEHPRLQGEPRQAPFAAAVPHDEIEGDGWITIWPRPRNDTRAREGGNLVIDESPEEALTADLARPGTALRKDAGRIEAALRDLVLNVDHMRSLLQDRKNSPSAQVLLGLLDTSRAHEALSP